MKRIIASLVLAVMLLLIPAGSAFAAKTATVTITMTGGTLSITASSTPSPYSFGTVVQDATYSNNLTVFTVTNDGTVTANIYIHGADTTGGSPSWALQASPGVDIYALKFSRNLAPLWTTITTVDTTYMNGLAKTISDNFGLQLLTPTTIGDTTNLKTAIVTLTASQAP